MTNDAHARLRDDWRLAAPLIDGITPEVAETLAVTNPATGDEIGRVALADVRRADDAVAAARRAFPAWRDMPTAERGAIVLAAVEAVEAMADEVAALISLEVGKVLHEAQGDIRGALAMVRGMVQLVAELEAGEDRTGLPGTGQASFVRLRHVPVGPVAVIGPWNTPVFLTFNAIAPALAAGATLVVKPAVEAPLALTATLRAMAAHLPPGVINIVPGRGSIVGQRLAEHPDVRALSFTGSTGTGRRIAAAAAGNIKKIALELGGNDPAIVLGSAEITDSLVTELVAGCYSMTGQICFNIKRIYVHHSRHDELVEKFSAAASRIVVGDAFDPTAHIGPLTTREGYQNALRLLAEARAAGAVVHELGIRADSADWSAGYYVAPTVVTGIPTDHELVLDEQFAPIIPIVPFDTDDEAIVEANRTDFGLASSVWSQNLAHAEAVARRIEAGNTFINAHRLGASVPLVPFGGVKQSGLGRTHLLYSLEHVTDEHGIVGFSSPAAQLPGITRWQNVLAAPTAKENV
ncbi:aldehyde dehydrogenase family protein [Microbacterium terregens]